MNLPKPNYYKLVYLLLFIYLCWPSRFAMIYYENIAVNIRNSRTWNHENY